MMTVTPLWIADLHRYAWTREINSLSLGRCKSTSSHCADKAKPQRGFYNRSHDAVLSVAPRKRCFSELITRKGIFGFLEFGTWVNAVFRLERLQGAPAKLPLTATSKLV
jgi:hypothetical protein